jgi:hypothetical protein
MVVVAQLVRAPDCGSGGRRFEPGHPPEEALSKASFYLTDLMQEFLNNGIQVFPLNRL